MNSFHSPDTLARPGGYVHAVRSTCRTTVLVSGQVAYEASGLIVGLGDLAAQTRQVYANIGKALEAAGASMHDLVKTTLYVVGLDQEKARVIRAARAPLLKPGAPPASTMVGVASLADPVLQLLFPWIARGAVRGLRARAAALARGERDAA